MRPFEIRQLASCWERSWLLDTPTRRGRCCRDPTIDLVSNLKPVGVRCGVLGNVAIMISLLILLVTWEFIRRARRIFHSLSFGS